jgi:hypothetical protein
MPAEIVAVEAEKRLATFDPQQTEAYLRWRAKQGDVPALPEKGDGEPWVVEIEP